MHAVEHRGKHPIGSSASQLPTVVSVWANSSCDFGTEGWGFESLRARLGLVVPLLVRHQVYVTATPIAASRNVAQPLAASCLRAPTLAPVASCAGHGNQCSPAIRPPLPRSSVQTDATTGKQCSTLARTSGQNENTPGSTRNRRQRRSFATISRADCASSGAYSRDLLCGATYGGYNRWVDVAGVADSQFGGDRDLSAQPRLRR